MEIEALERPAGLAIWCAVAANWLLAEPERFGSLQEAIEAATSTISDSSKQPWIITEDGEMLPPNWIRSYLN